MILFVTRQAFDFLRRTCKERPLAATNSMNEAMTSAGNKRMRRRLVIKKSLQRGRLNRCRQAGSRLEVADALKTMAKQAAGGSKSGKYNFRLISAGLTDLFTG
jgi:hypothetical protein